MMGGANPHKEAPSVNSFRPPSPRYVLPPPPIPFLFTKSFRNSQDVPQPGNPSSQGLETWFPRDHPRGVLLLGTFCPPPEPGIIEFPACFPHTKLCFLYCVCFFWEIHCSLSHPYSVEHSAVAISRRARQMSRCIASENAFGPDVRFEGLGAGPTTEFNVLRVKESSSVCKWNNLCTYAPRTVVEG